MLDPINNDISFRGGIADLEGYMLDAWHDGTSAVPASRSFCSSSSTCLTGMRHRPISRTPKPRCSHQWRMVTVCHAKASSSLRSANRIRFHTAVPMLALSGGLGAPAGENYFQQAGRKFTRTPIVLACQISLAPHHCKETRALQLRLCIRPGAGMLTHLGPKSFPCRALQQIFRTTGRIADLVAQNNGRCLLSKCIRWIAEL
jgi:hypothetical protein